MLTRIVEEDGAFVIGHGSLQHPKEGAALADGWEGKRLVAVEEGTLEAEKQKSKKGETMAAAEFYYDPQLAEAVRLLYEGCDGPCACNDQYLQVQHRCSITDEDVRVFFDPARGHPKYTNAYCAQRAAAPIHAHGDLQGGWHSMTYDPAAKASMVSLYKTCAKHVPCP